MKKSLEPMSFKRTLAGFLQQVTEADVAMQLNQIESWREAARLDPLMDGFEMSTPSAAVSDQEDHVITHLMEGVDRLNNLAIGEVILEFDLEMKKPAILKRIWAFIRGISLPRHYRLAPPLRVAETQPRLKVKLKARRRPLGAWESTPREPYPKELYKVALPELF